MPCSGGKINELIRLFGRNLAANLNECIIATALPELARALGAEGSFTRSGSRTHVTLQLIRADNDSHIWAETYVHDGNDETVLAEAAKAVAERGSVVRYLIPSLRDTSPQRRTMPTCRNNILAHAAESNGDSARLCRSLSRLGELLRRRHRGE